MAPQEAAKSTSAPPTPQRPPRRRKKSQANSSPPVSTSTSKIISPDPHTDHSLAASTAAAEPSATDFNSPDSSHTNRRLASQRALVLNSSYQPVKMVSWQRALILWFQGKVEVVEYHTEVARSARAEFQIPSVLRLKRYVNQRRFARVKFCRENVYRRDNFTCQYCGEHFHPRDLTLDHVVPASRSGRKDWTNMVTACRRCNHRKANRTPLAAGMPLLNEPRVPAWLPPLETASRWESLPESWKVYLGEEPSDSSEEATG